MSDEQTPREIIAKLAEMSDREFSQFMVRHFEQLCKRLLPDDSALKTAQRKTDARSNDPQ